MVQDEGVATISCYVVIVLITTIIPNHNSSMLIEGVEKGKVLDALISQLAVT